MILSAGGKFALSLQVEFEKGDQCFVIFGSGTFPSTSALGSVVSLTVVVRTVEGGTDLEAN